MSSKYYLLVEKIIIGGTQYGFLWAMANKYSQINYGLYQYTLTLTAFIVLIMQLIDEKVIKTSILNGPPGWVITNVITGKAAASLIIFLSLLLYEAVVHVKVNVLLNLLVLSAVMSSMSSSIIYYFDATSKSEKRVIITSAICTLTFIFQVISIFTDQGLETIALASVIAQALGILLIYAMTKQYFTIKTKFINKNEIRRLIGQSTPFALATIAYLVYTRTDVLMLEHYAGYEAVASYSLAIQLTSILIIMLYPLQVNYFPTLAKVTVNRYRYLRQYILHTNEACRLGAVISLVGLIVIIFLIEYAFPKEYADVRYVMVIQSLTALIMYNAVLKSTHLTFLKAGHILLLINISAIILNVTLNYLLIPSQGILGASISTLICAVYSLIIANIFFKETKMLFWIQLKSLKIWRS